MFGTAYEGAAPWRATAVIELSDVRPLEPGFTEAGSAIELPCLRLADIAARVRRRVDLLAELDLVSQDVLFGVVRKLEEQLWMTRAQLAD